MKKEELLRMLKEGDVIEESSISVLAQVISFYIGRVSDYGMSVEVQNKMKTILGQLKDDCEKHKRLLNETKAIVEKEALDDF